MYRTVVEEKEIYVCHHPGGPMGGALGTRTLLLASVSTRYAWKLYRRSFHVLVVLTRRSNTRILVNEQKGIHL